MKDLEDSIITIEPLLSGERVSILKQKARCRALGRLLGISPEEVFNNRFFHSTNPEENSVSLAWL